jgi:dTDP-4-amino-4,6-dideoxygalactose transaminase
MKSFPHRIHLSKPHMGEAELGYVREAFAANWLSTVGPNLEALEAAFERRVGRPAVARSCGTTATASIGSRAEECIEVTRRVPPR